MWMMALPALSLGAAFFGGTSNSMGQCSSGLLGNQTNGALTGFGVGSLVGTLLGRSPLGMLAGGGLGALLGGWLGRNNQQNCQCPNHGGAQNNYPPYNSQYCPSQQGGNVGYNQGYRDGYYAGQQQGYGPGYGQPGNGQPGCGCPHGQWNNGLPPQQQCPGQGQQNHNGGQLCQEDKGKPISYTTSGGWKVDINKDKVTITDPTGKHKLEHSGDPHEYANGQHLKDWEGKQRTIQLPDGTKITMGAQGPQGVVENTSIYDGNQNIQIDNRSNEITHRSFDPRDTQYRERMQYDGETSGLSHRRDGGLDYSNYYTQDENFGLKSNYRNIATYERDDSWRLPWVDNSKFKVVDRYDDPRLGNT